MADILEALLYLSIHIEPPELHSDPRVLLCEIFLVLGNLYPCQRIPLLNI